MMRSTIAACAATLLLGFGSQVLAQGNPLRDAYFGETHVHTSWSLDAWTFGNRVTGPGDAYKYFKGEPIKHPLGYDIKIDTPLDFAGVTDHSEYVGVVKLANDPNSSVSKLPAAAPLILKNNSEEEVQKVYLYAIHLLTSPPVKSLMGPQIAHTVWAETVKLANEANEPGKFTAFCSYEWTSMPNAMNLHRNVFFKDCAHVPEMPFSALDSPVPFTYGSGWTTSARRATTFWQFHITPTSPMGACTLLRSTSTGDRSTGLMLKTGCATSP